MGYSSRTAEISSIGCCWRRCMDLIGTLLELQEDQDVQSQCAYTEAICRLLRRYEGLLYLSLKPDSSLRISLQSLQLATSASTLLLKFITYTGQWRAVLPSELLEFMRRRDLREDEIPNPNIFEITRELLIIVLGVAADHSQSGQSPRMNSFC